MRRLRLVVLASVAGVVAAAACTLNPQPLPPGDGESSSFGGEDASSKTDAGRFGENPTSPQDAGATSRDGGANDGDGSPSPGDAGDGGADSGVDADAG